MDIEKIWGDENEQPLDRLVTDGGFAGLFRTIACVGDSLSSGEFEAVNEEGKKTYHDYFDYSWGQYLARMAGCTVYNFSKGGMTAKAYCNSFAETKGYWAPELAAQAYIIALGVNDVCNQKQEVGTIEDVNLEDYTQNKDTFAGWYGRVIQRYRAIRPDAKFFYMTMPRSGVSGERDEIAERHAALLYDFARVFPNSYVLDLRKYGPVYDSNFRQRFYLGGHMNPCGYILTAQMVASYLDYIIRHNIKDFKQVGFIGTPFRNPNP